jgi:type II secretory pathway pseudopilin PulG
VNPVLRRLRDDRGFTLVELLIYVGLVVVIVGIVGGILINSLGVDKTVRSATAAASAGQLISQSIDQGVRNASYIALTTSGAQQFLLVRTAGSGATITWSCRAWYLTTANGGAAYVKNSATAITSPIGGSLTGWTQISTGFTGVNGATTILTKTGSQVAIGLKMTAGQASPVLIQTTAVSRQTDTGSAPCV